MNKVIFSSLLIWKLVLGKTNRKISLSFSTINFAINLTVFICKQHTFVLWAERKKKPSGFQNRKQKSEECKKFKVKSLYEDWKIHCYKKNRKFFGYTSKTQASS